jgi:hypothetical protein
MKGTVMDDDTTTTPAVPEEAGAEAQPVAPVEPDAAAEAASTEPSEVPQDGQPAAPEVDTELQKYAESNGIALDSPGAIKAAEIARKAQSEATRNYQKANELEKATKILPEQVSEDATPQQHDNVRLRNLELRYEAQTWKLQNPDKAAMEPQMVEILANDPNKRYLVQEGLLNYDDLYAMARGRGDNSAAVKSEAKRETLQSLAHKQQAAVPRGNATNPGVTPATKRPEDMSIEELSAKVGTFRR